MREISNAVAETLGLESREGGWDAPEGGEITLVVDGGSSALPIGSISRVVTTDEGWFVWKVDSDEVAWIDGKSVILLGSKGSGKAGRGKRAGFV